jgi:hypothetical protein
MAKMFDSDASPQDAGFNAVRIGIAIVAEYEPVVTDPDSPLGWAIADLRSVVLDLVGALMADDPDSIRDYTVELLDIADDTFGYT